MVEEEAIIEKVLDQIGEGGIDGDIDEAQSVVVIVPG